MASVSTSYYLNLNEYSQSNNYKTTGFYIYPNINEYSQSINYKFLMWPK